MKHRSSSSYGGLSAGIALATAMADAGLYIFSTDDAQRLAAADVPAGRVPYLLKLLADAGWLIRLRRDLYAGTGRLPGGVDVPPFAIATSLVAPSAVSHWSALAYHGLTDQVPVVVTATTTRRVVTPRMRVSATPASPATPAVLATPARRQPAGIWRVAGIDCRYVTVVPDRYFGIEPVWLDQRFRVAITDRAAVPGARPLRHARPLRQHQRGSRRRRAYRRRLDLARLIGTRAAL